MAGDKPKGRVRSKKHEKPLARSPETRENELINLAMDVAEEQLRKGTATSQVITHFLKLGSQTEVLQRQKLERENRLLDAKVDQIESQKKIEELYQEAIIVMRRYSGSSESDFELDENDV